MKIYGSKTQLLIQLVFWFLQYWTRPVGIPDTSGIHRIETLTFCPWPYRTRPIGAGQKQIIHCLWFFVLAIVFILCPVSQQINCSTREPLKASYGKIKYFSIIHFQYFTNMPICELSNTKRTRWLSYKV